MARKYRAMLAGIQGLHVYESPVLVEAAFQEQTVEVGIPSNKVSRRGVGGDRGALNSMVQRRSGMFFRKLGDTGIELPAVTFGAWAIGGWMWGKPDDKASIRAIQRGIDLGMTCIDTAPAYGRGHSELIVGEAIVGRRDEAIIATKCGLRSDLQGRDGSFKTQDVDGSPYEISSTLEPDSIRFEIDESLQRLGVDYVDLYQCHWPDPRIPIADTIGALDEIKTQGKIRAYGVCNFDRPLLEEAMRHGAPASNQIPYNALERGNDAELIPFCRGHDIGVMSYGTIAKGLLSERMTPERQFAATDHRREEPLFSVENRRRIQAMIQRVHRIAESHQVTIAQLFIAWVLAQPGLTTAIVGARDERQVEENAAAGDLQLAEDEIIFVRDAVDAMELARTQEASGVARTSTPV